MTASRRRPGWRPLVVVAFAVLVSLAVVVAALVDRPPGPPRYRTHVFSDVVVTPDLAYREAVNNAGERVVLRLDVYEPGDDDLDSRPAIVLAHGGAFRGGDKRSERIVDLARGSALRGFVVASISYRVRPLGTPDAPTVRALIRAGLAGRRHPAVLDAVEDMQAAVRWLRERASRHRVDPDRIVVAGYSAGGVMALDTAIGIGSAPMPRVAGAIAIAAATEVPDEAPLRRPPVLIVGGTRDTTVPFVLARRSCRELRERSVPCELRAFEGADHALQSRWARVEATSAAFLCAHVVRCAA